MSVPESPNDRSEGAEADETNILRKLYQGLDGSVSDWRR